MNGWTTNGIWHDASYYQSLADDILIEDPAYDYINKNNYIDAGNTGFGNMNNEYSAIVDMVGQNNAFSAEQAQKQMKFQERLFNLANDFNHNEAELNREFQQDSADRAMAFSSAEAEANRAWQKMMSDTAHQREMADLQAAGLNPILAANNGSSAGVGSAALSASAAGYGASSVGSPSGSKADGDQSGTMAIASLMGKMLDNQTEITKMITSAETARETAEMYTGATKYAAELGSIASQYASDNSAAASRYGSDISAMIANMNPYNVLGSQINDILAGVNSTGFNATNVGKMLAGDNGINEAAKSLADKTKSFISKAYNYVTGNYGKHKSGKF